MLDFLATYWWCFGLGFFFGILLFISVVFLDSISSMYDWSLAKLCLLAIAWLTCSCSVILFWIGVICAVIRWAK